HTPWWSFSPAGQEQVRTAIARASTGETVRFETLVHPREGVFLYLEGRITPQLDLHHHTECLASGGKDSSATQRAGDDSREMREAIPESVWILRPDGSIEYSNQRLRDYTNMTVEQLQGDGWMQYTHPDDWQHVLAAWQRAVQSGRPYEVEQRMRHG